MILNLDIFLILSHFLNQKLREIKHKPSFIQHKFNLLRKQSLLHFSQTVLTVLFIAQLTLLKGNNMYRIKMALILTFFLNAPLVAQNYIGYTDTVDNNTLQQKVLEHYLIITNTCGLGEPNPNCFQAQYVPPPSPEYWYFLNDNISELIKYTAQSNNGVLSVTAENLTSTEKYYSDQAKIIRQQTWDAWKNFEQHYQGPSVQKNFYPDYTLGESCNADGALESEDSPFDYFDNNNLRDQLKDRIMAEHPTTTTRINGVNAGLGAVSFGVSWDSAASFGTATMPDGGTLVFYLDTSNNINRPVLDLSLSRTASGNRLSNYFVPSGPILNDHFKAKAGTHSFLNECEAEEFESAIEGLNPFVFGGIPPEGASEGEYGFGSCQRSGGFNNSFSVYYPVYYVAENGSVTFVYERHTLFADDPNNGCPSE